MSNPMDLSSLPEEERQQLQKLQERFEEHQKQQEKQQQIPNHPSQPYGVSHVQNQSPYDHHYQPFYGYYSYQAPGESSSQHPPFPLDHQQQQYYQDHQLQQEHYYHTKHIDAYQEHHLQQPDPHPLHLPHQMVPVPHPSGHLVNLQPQPQPQPQPLPPPEGQVPVHHQQNVSYPQIGTSDGDQQQSGTLNPAAAAAVAALSQLMQFAGTMGDAERALAMIGLHANGISGYGPPLPHDPGENIPQAGQTMYLGGNPRGGSSYFPNKPHGKTKQRNGKAKMSEPAGMATKKVQTPAAWCDLCKVECTSLEILEQHKNGKKHMKNLGKNGTSSSTTPATTETAAANAQPEANEEKNNNNLTGQKREPNHKPKAAVAKRPRLSDTQKRPFENSKPKVVVPLLCGLCNIKCDTQEVLNKHLSGKKHISKLKRYGSHSHQGVHGQIGFQSLYHHNAPIEPLHFPHVHQQHHLYHQQQNQ